MNSTESVRTDTGPFAITPEWVLDAEISDRAKVLYAIIGRYADQEGKAFPSRRTLAKRLRCSDDSIDRAMKELVAFGALIVEHRFEESEDGKRQTSNTYALLRHPGRTAAAGGVREAAAPPTRKAAAPRTRASKELEPVEREGPTALARQNGSQALVATYVDYARELGVNPPRRLVGQVAKLVGELLGEGQDPETVAKALRIMLDRRLHPATLPSLIPEARAGPAKRQSDLDADYERMRDELRAG